jgi:hypothetical protein
MWRQCHLSGVFVALVVFVGSAIPAISAIKLAVWGTEDQRNATACLIAEISRIPDNYVVLEREQLERVVAEAALQAQGLTFANTIAAARLSGANGVLWVEGGNIAGRQVVITRLCAVGSGVVVGWQIDDGPLPDPEAWAQIMAKRVANWRAKLGIARERAVPISLVDIRSATDSEKSNTSGQTLRTLLGSRLTAEPELFVLERWRLEELAWEQVLDGNPFPEFWNGAWLLDGSVTDAGGQVELSMRLRASAGKEIRWTRRGSDRDLMRLVNELTTDVLERLAAGKSPTAWDSQSEAKEFLAEAEWAARWNRDALALQASEAAFALGLDSVAIQRLRYLASSRIAGKAVGEIHRMQSPLGITLPTTVMPKKSVIEQSLRAIALYNDFRSSPAGIDYFGSQPNASSANAVPEPRDAVGLLSDASRILWRAYFAIPSHTAEVPTEVVRLRGEARDLFEREFSRIEKDFHPHPSDCIQPVDRGGRMSPVALNTLPLVGLAWGSLWAECSMDQEALIRKIIGNQPTSSKWFYDDVWQVISSGTGTWEVDWKTHDASRAIANWERFYRELLKEQSLCPQFAAAIWLLSPSTKLSAENGIPNQLKLSEEFWLPFVDHLDALHEGRLPAEYFQEMLREAGAGIPLPVLDGLVEKLANLLAGPGVISDPLLGLTYNMALHPHHKERLSTVLKQKISDFGPKVLGEKIHQQNILACLKKLGVETADMMTSGRALPNANNPMVRQGSVHARAAWLELGGQGIRWVSLIDDQLWVVSALPPEGHFRAPQRYALRKITLPDLKAEEVLTWNNEHPEDMAYSEKFPSFAILAGAMYSWEGQSLCRRKIAGGQRETIALPITGRPNLWAVNGMLYLGLDSGGVLRVDPQTNSWELLANSKRRPAQGILDDCPPYGVEHIWHDPVRGLCVMVGSVHAFDEKTRQWSGSRRVDNMSYKNPFDRTQALESLYGIENACGSDRSFTVDLLLGDVHRVGVIPIRSFDAGMYFGGQPPLENGLTQWDLIGYMAEKKDLWALFQHVSKPDDSPHLVWMPGLPGETVAIEVRLPKEALARIPAATSQLQGGFVVGEPVRIISSRHGLAFYQTRSAALWFITRDDLVAAGVSSQDSR